MILDALTLWPATVALAMTAYNVFAWPRDEDIAAPAGSVSVLVPARNEEDGIERCVRGVMSALGPGDEMIVCDDGSTDTTPVILARLQQEFPALRVIDGAPLPPGWVGKPHACHQLGQAARGDILMFVDADVELFPTAIQRMASLFDRYEADLLTVFPGQLMFTPAEKSVVPMLMVTFTAWLPLDLIHKTEAPSIMVCSGQLMAFTRDAYEAVGGYEAVAGDVVDDMAMCMATKAAGKRVVFASGTETAKTRMYASWADVWEGFSKNMFEGLHENLALLAGVVALYFAAFVLPWARLGAEWLWGVPSAVAMAAVTANVAMRVLIAWRVRHDPWSVLFHPLGALSVVVIAINSARWSRRGKVVWRGRTYGARDTRVRKSG